MKMNRISGSKFPSWLLSRFRKQEDVISPDTAAAGNNTSGNSVFTDKSAAGKDISSEKAANKEACSENAENVTLTEAASAKKPEAENYVMEFGIEHGTKSEAASEFSFGIETMKEITKKTPVSMDCCNADINNDTNKTPAITDDIANAGTGVNAAADPFKILDQLSSIKKSRTKKRR